MEKFAKILEDVKNLNLDEIEELHLLTEKYIVEKRRIEFEKSHQESLKEYKKGKLKASKDINEIVSELDHNTAIFENIGNHDEVY